MDEQLEKMERGIDWFMRRIVCPGVVILLIALCIAQWMIALGNS